MLDFSVLEKKVKEKNNTLFNYNKGKDTDSKIIKKYIFNYLLAKMFIAKDKVVILGFTVLKLQEKFSHFQIIIKGKF